MKHSATPLAIALLAAPCLEAQAVEYKCTRCGHTTSVYQLMAKHMLDTCGVGLGTTEIVGSPGDKIVVNNGGSEAGEYAEPVDVYDPAILEDLVLEWWTVWIYAGKDVDWMHDKKLHNHWTDLAPGGASATYSRTIKSYWEVSGGGSAGIDLKGVVSQAEFSAKYGNATDHTVTWSFPQGTPGTVWGNTRVMGTSWKCTREYRRVTNPHLFIIGQGGYEIIQEQVAWPTSEKSSLPDTVGTIEGTPEHNKWQFKRVGR